MPDNMINSLINIGINFLTWVMAGGDGPWRNLEISIELGNSSEWEGPIDFYELAVAKALLGQNVKVWA